MLTKKLVFLLLPLSLVLGISVPLQQSQHAQAAISLPSTTVRGNGLFEMARFMGQYSFSADGLAAVDRQGNLTVEKPTGATVEAAFLVAASRFQTTTDAPDVTLGGSGVTFTHRSGSGGGVVNWLADVTSLISDDIDGAAPGQISVAADYNSEGSTDAKKLYSGIALTVVFSDPNVDAGTTIFQFGHATTSGQTTTLEFDAIETVPAEAQLSLGISWSIQVNSIPEGFNTVEVSTSSNGTPQTLTEYAGGYDDATNAATFNYLSPRDQLKWPLVTVGGVGDSPSNPTNPLIAGGWSTYASDDELYDVAGFLQTGDTSLTLETSNASGDDSLFQIVLSIPGVLANSTVTFDANDGSGGTSTQVSNEAASLTANSFTRSGYAFTGWNTAAAGSGTAYADQATFPFAGDTTLYAQWAEEFDVTFDSNGGSGSMSAQTAAGSTALSANTFTRSGYAFSGWNTAADSSGTAYANGAAFPFTADDTLFAQWTLAPSGSSGGSSGSSSASNPVVTPAAPALTPRQTRLSPVGPNTNPVPRPVERLGLVFDPDAPSRATVGGVPASLVKTPVGSKDLSIAAGAFQFGVSLADADGAEVQTDTPSQSPELFVPRGQSATVTGQGSYPGSFVQLFLPGNGNDSRELARIPVRSDGTFASDLSFEAGALELPVPIGRQVLQVVGYDEQGNQTVVDMTVNIGQGVPAPEPNRQAGELPALNAGQSLATSGGIPETVAVKGVPETGNVVVEGSGWVISVNADRDNGTVENADGNVLVRLNPSSVGTTFGNGFLPGTLATVWLFSEPTLMTTVTVDENGEFSAEFLVDARLIAPGEHTLQVQGVGSDGYIKAANLGVLVEEPVEVTAESASGLLWWIIGFFVLALLLFFFLLARRRRREA